MIIGKHYRVALNNDYDNWAEQPGPEHTFGGKVVVLRGILDEGSSEYYKAAFLPDQGLDADYPPNYAWTFDGHELEEL